MLAFETTITGWGDLFFVVATIAIIIWLVLVFTGRRKV
jgi:hypothetical protein